MSVPHNGHRRIQTVAVVGAGVAGLATVKSCLEVGLEPTCFECKDGVGGIWNERTDQWNADGPKMYNSLMTNTSKSMTCFSDYPFPAHFPPYMPYKLFSQYLDDYADHFKLRKHVKFGTKVEKVYNPKDVNLTGGWCLEIVNTSGEKSCEKFDAVIVCSGFFYKSRMPDILGMDQFVGQRLHSKDFLKSDPFIGQSVLVIGNATSAGDIAADVCNVAKQVYLSIGDGSTILSRITPSGLPLDHGLKRVFLKLFDVSRLVGFIKKQAQKRYNHRILGLLYTGVNKAFCPVILSDDLPVRVMSGKVKVLGHVTSIGRNSFTTEDNETFENIDTIICATGYSRNLSFLDPDLKCGEDKLELYKQVFPLADPTQSVAIVGCIRLAGPIPPTLELQARMAAYALAGTYKLPSRDKMIKDIEKRNKAAVRPDGSYKYSFVSLVASDEVAQEIGVLPSFWKFLLTGRLWLAYKLLFGPAFPFHYRIVGQGSWSGAAKAIQDAPKENVQPLMNRKALCNYKEKHSPLLSYVLAACVALRDCCFITCINSGCAALV